MLPSNIADAFPFDVIWFSPFSLLRFSLSLCDFLDDRAVTVTVPIPLVFPLVIFHIPPMFLAIPYTASVRVSHCLHFRYTMSIGVPWHSVNFA